jgi:hypothetical protein
VINAGEVPVHLVADARLVSLEITRRGDRRPIRCELPAAMLPDDTLGRTIVLPPHHAFAEDIDPRLYCFGAPLADALVPGAVVVARLGRAGRGPVVFPVHDKGANPPLTAVLELEAPPVAVPDDPTPPLPAPWPRSPDEGAAGGSSRVRPGLTLSAPDAIDALVAEEVAIPLTLHNEGSSSVVVRFRPDTVGFDVSRPGIAMRCEWPVLPGAPSRELYAVVPPQGVLELSLMLMSYCPTSMFQHPGLMIVRPWLDTRATSGRLVGVRSFDGLVVAGRTTLVLLERGSAPEPVTDPRLLEVP